MSWKSLIVFALVIGAMWGSTGSTSGQNLAAVFEVEDSYEKNLTAGGEVTYTWLVFNQNASFLLVTTDIDPSAKKGEWDASLEPSFATLGPTDSLEIILVVQATDALKDGSVTFTLTIEFALALDPMVTETETRTAVAILEAVPSLLAEENKILGIFDPLPAPFDDRRVTFGISIAVWAGFAALAILVVTPVLRKYARRTETDLDEVILKIMPRPLVLLLIAFGAVQSLAILQLPVETINLLFLIYSALLVLLLTWVAFRLFRGVVIEFGRRAAAKRETPLFDAAWPLVSKIGAILILVVGASLVAGVFGLDLTAFIAGMGVLGIAIAFAAQDSLSNFFSGIFLIADRDINEGDLIEINGDRCRIEKIGLRTTKLYHRPSHKILVIPNSKMSKEMVVNLVGPDSAIRQSTTVGVAYGSDIEKVKAALAAAAKENPMVITDSPSREAYAGLEEFGDYALLFKLKFWISDADKMNRVRREVNESIVKHLAEAGIEVPFPIVTLDLEG
ncbi:MAG: mechanosensitive ion channel family protein [Candidatus Thermoplasmatota archaeon]|nr:mechanosensitive ion channel family protein [Candidatus Thermoplasmatota archaeon]